MITQNDGSALQIRFRAENGRELTLSELVAQDALKEAPKMQINPCWTEMLKNYSAGSSSIMGGIHYSFSVTDEAGNRILPAGRRR
ncbi:MAG: hypothetical protein E7240_02365 [Lachnospiraceae bacterium]|nr:hypothetical protein [Lachnospiraceae bacterium]